jgi:integrase
MRHSELLGLIWQDIDIAGGSIHVRAQLSRAHRGRPAKRVVPKTRAGVRRIPLSSQLAAVLREHRSASRFSADTDWVFVTRNGTPLSQRNVQRSTLDRAAHVAGLDRDGGRLRFHDLRHTFASHLVIDVALDVVQVSRILGHSNVSTTLNIYAHLFEEARHAADIRARMSRSEFARLLDTNDNPNVVVLPAAATTAARPRSARERAAIRWAT